MYHYVYRVEDTGTGEYYIGSRSSKFHPSIDSYLGSMKTWKPDKLKLRKIIIKDDFVTREEAIKFESEEIKKNIENILNRNYNIPDSKFFTTGFVTVRDENGKCFNISIDDERYINGKLKHNRDGMKNKFPTRKRSDEEELERVRRVEIKGSHKGNKNSQFGTRWINNGMDSKKIRNSDIVPEGWKLGAIQNKLKGLGWITNGIENARLGKEEIPPDGWKFGKIQRKK